MTKPVSLSPDLWKLILQFTAKCDIQVMDTVFNEESCEMGMAFVGSCHVNGMDELVL